MSPVPSRASPESSPPPSPASPGPPRHAPAPPNGRPGDGAPSAAAPPAIPTSALKRSGRNPDGARARRAGPAPAGSPSPAHDPAAAVRTPAQTPARPASDPAPPPRARATRSPRGAPRASREALPRRPSTRRNTPRRAGTTPKWPTTRSDCGSSLPSKRNITGRAEPCRAILFITRQDRGPGSAPPSVAPGSAAGKGLRSGQEDEDADLAPGHSVLPPGGERARSSGTARSSSGAIRGRAAPPLRGQPRSRLVDEHHYRCAGRQEGALAMALLQSPAIW